jgi:hypothetical protein
LQRAGRQGWIGFNRGGKIPQFDYKSIDLEIAELDKRLQIVEMERSGGLHHLK